MPLTNDIFKKASLSAAIVLSLVGQAGSAPFLSAGLAAQVKGQPARSFEIPVPAFRDAALLSRPPHFASYSPGPKVPPPSTPTPKLQAVALARPVEHLPSPKAKPVQPAGAFDSIALPFKRLAALKRFEMIADFSSDPSISCDPGGCVSGQQQHGSRELRKQSIRDRINLVNVAVNRSIQYRRDIDTYGVMDRWAGPGETLARRQGDCEDFAILKMAALQSYGVDRDAMSLVVVFDQKRRFYHAVLAVEVEGRNYILDNLSDQVRLDSQLPDYVALYSIRDGKGFIHGARSKSKAIAATASLSDIAPGEGMVGIDS